MTNEVVKTPREIDGYEAFEDAIEGQEEHQPPSAAGRWLEIE